VTQKRRDDSGTEYGKWTREQPGLDSALGFVATNIDWVWRNYKTGLWMLKEEKRHRWLPKIYQVQMYQLVDACCRSSADYRGFHVVVFEETSPDDGWVYLDGAYITKSELVQFLQFEAPDMFYKSWFPPKGLLRLPENVP